MTQRNRHSQTHGMQPAQNAVTMYIESRLIDARPPSDLLVFPLPIALLALLDGEALLTVNAVPLQGVLREEVSQ